MPKDISGKRYGKLVAIKPTEEKSKMGIVWLCKCDCGSYRKVSVGYLNTGYAVDCGCGREERKLKRTIDLTGKRFGRLVAIEREESINKSGNSWTVWKCQCDCGNVISVCTHLLRSGRTKSCGCLKIERDSERHIKHGMHDKKLYYVWRSMKSRCYNTNEKSYHNYGARGITVCDEWKDDFQAFYDWSIKNGYNENAKHGECTLDRIYNDKGYSPDNCRWVTLKEQQRNKRTNHLMTYNGKTQTVIQWAEETGIKKETLYARVLTLGWSDEKAITTPVKKKGRR